jgi:hypothetical protein
MIKPQNGSIGSTIAYHSEASYSVRKNIIEKARERIKELEKAEINALLSHSY